MTSEYEIEIFCTESGKEPFIEWIHSLKDKQSVRTIFLRLQRIRLGNFGDCKNLGEINELRIDYGPGFRIYFAKIGLKLILILAGGDKRTQTKDIIKCRLLLKEYKER